MEAAMYRVWYVNFDYGHSGFGSLAAAVKHAEQVCFESLVYNDANVIVARFSPISGTRYYKEETDAE
jgi:hypothetical protein